MHNDTHVCRLYVSPLEVLLGFDIDSCCSTYTHTFHSSWSVLTPALPCSRLRRGARVVCEALPPRPDEALQPHQPDAPLAHLRAASVQIRQARYAPTQSGTVRRRPLSAPPPLGFAVAIPGLRKAEVDRAVFSRDVKKAQGLLKLCLFEYQTLYPEAVTVKSVSTHTHTYTQRT